MCTRSNQDSRTSSELIEAGYETVRAELAEAVLTQVMSCSPEFFEQLVVDLLVAMGYGGSRVDAGKAVGRRGDGGIDGIIKEDRLGLDAVYIQAKRWHKAEIQAERDAWDAKMEEFAGAATESLSHAYRPPGRTGLPPLEEESG